MEQNPSWVANSHSPSQEISRLLCNPMVHYCVHKIPPQVPILSQMNPAHTILRYFYKIHSNITLPSTPRSSEWALPFRFFDQNCVYIFTSFTHPSYLPWFCTPNNIFNRCVIYHRCRITFAMESKSIRKATDRENDPTGKHFVTSVQNEAGFESQT